MRCITWKIYPYFPQMMSSILQEVSRTSNDYWNFSKVMQNMFSCIALFCKFLIKYSIVFQNFFFRQISKYKIACNRSGRKMDSVLQHFRKGSVYHAFYTQTYAKCRFGLIFGLTYDNKMTCALVTCHPIFTNYIWRYCGSRQAVNDFDQGGQIPPPPPL